MGLFLPFQGAISIFDYKCYNRFITLPAFTNEVDLELSETLNSASKHSNSE